MHLQLKYRFGWTKRSKQYQPMQQLTISWNLEFLHWVDFENFAGPSLAPSIGGAGGFGDSVSLVSGPTASTATSGRRRAWKIINNSSTGCCWWCRPWSWSLTACSVFLIQRMRVGPSWRKNVICGLVPTEFFAIAMFCNHWLRYSNWLSRDPLQNF